MASNTEREEQIRKLLIEAHFNILETDVIDGQSLYSMRYIKDEIDKYFAKDETKTLMQLIDKYTEERERVAELREHELVMKWWSKPGVGDIKFSDWSHSRRKALRNLIEFQTKENK